MGAKERENKQDNGILEGKRMEENKKKERKKEKTKLKWEKRKSRCFSSHPFLTNNPIFISYSHLSHQPSNQACNSNKQANNTIQQSHIHRLSPILLHLTSALHATYSAAEIGGTVSRIHDPYPSLSTKIASLFACSATFVLTE